MNPHAAKESTVNLHVVKPAPVRHALAGTFTRKELRAALARLRPLLEGGAFPLVRLAVEANGATKLRATDGATVAEICGPQAFGAIVDGAVVLPLAALKALAKASQGVGSNRLEVDLEGWIRVDDDSTAWRALPVSVFPAEATELDGHAATATIPGAQLHRALTAVMHAVSWDATRPHLHGVHLAARAGAWVAEATDGHRAARQPMYGGDALVDREVTLPAPMVAVAANIAGTNAMSDPSLAWGARGVRLESCTGEWVAAWLPRNAGLFPRLDMVIPAVTKEVARIDPSKLARVVADATGEGVTLRLQDDTLDVEGAGEKVRSLPCSYDRSTRRVGLNARYLAEALAGVGLLEREATLQVAGDTDPVVIRHPTSGYVAVVMPIRI